MKVWSDAKRLHALLRAVDASGIEEPTDFLTRATVAGYLQHRADAYERDGELFTALALRQMAVDIEEHREGQPRVVFHGENGETLIEDLLGA